MRSIALKLTVAFLAVGFVVALLVTIVARVGTQRGFERFLIANFQYNLSTTLGEYYAEHQSWENIDTFFRHNRFGREGPNKRLPFVYLADAQQAIIFGGRDERIGRRLTAEELGRAHSITVEDKNVGWVLFEAPVDSNNPRGPALAFLAGINASLAYTGTGAAILALILGGLLARSFTRPIRELIAATQRVARGELGHQVSIKTRDEIGQLAASFNRMSVDLAQANHLRRQMTADVAHDLRTPLSTILGYAEALSDNKLQGTPEIYEVIYNEAQHLNHLIDDLRTLSLADAGELPLHRQPTDPTEILQRVALAYKAQAEEQQISLQVAASANLPLIDADPERLVQVLGNLLANALNHTPATGEIHLTAQAEANIVKISIQDSGTGISPEDLPHIFERFYRGDKSRHTNGSSGLGLSIARSIVEAHGGTIAATSSVGQGTTFTLKIPRAEGV